MAEQGDLGRVHIVPDSKASPDVQQKVHEAALVVEKELQKKGLAQKESQGSTQIGLASREEPPFPEFSWSSYIQGLGLLFLLLACLWIGVRMLRRYGRFSFIPRPDDLPKDALRMEAQMPLGPRKGLMVVRFLGQRLLLGVTDHEIRLLTKEYIMEEEKKEFEELMEQTPKPPKGDGP